MNIKGLRSLNLFAIILFFAIGNLIVLAQFLRIYTAYNFFPGATYYSTCLGILTIWIVFIMVFTVLLHKNTVMALDKGDYNTVKRWTMIGIIVGFAGGILPLVLFIVSYVSFDDALRAHHSGPPYSGNYQQGGQSRYCIMCKRQIPFDSNLCPYCGVPQSPDSAQYPPPPSL